MVTFTPHGRGVLVEHRLQPHVDLLALAEQGVEIHFAQHAAQRGLSELRGGVEEVRNLQDGQPRIDDPEVDHGVHLHGDVVAGDHVLRRDLQRVDAEGNAHDAVDGREHQDDARAFRLPQHAAQPEDYAALIFPQNLDEVSR